MKAVIYLITSFVLVFCGCTTTSRTSLNATDENSFHLMLVRPRSDSGRAVRLPVQIDGKDIAKLKNGDHLELVLAPGTHTLSSRRGVLFGHDFPPATVTIISKAGERRAFRYVMEYGPKVGSYSVGAGVDINYVTAQPFKAEWQEMAIEEVQKLLQSACADGAR